MLLETNLTPNLDPSTDSCLGLLDFESFVKLLPGTALAFLQSGKIFDPEQTLVFGEQRLSRVFVAWAFQRTRQKLCSQLRTQHLAFLDL